MTCRLIPLELKPRAAIVNLILLYELFASQRPVSCSFCVIISIFLMLMRIERRQDDKASRYKRFMDLTS